MTHFDSRLIEDQQVFTKDVYVRLMRLIPKDAMPQDSIQRILRYIKQHEPITERDYLDSIELAGHSLKF